MASGAEGGEAPSSPFDAESLAREQLTALTGEEVERLLTDAGQHPWPQQWFLDLIKAEARDHRERRPNTIDPVAQQAANLLEFNRTLSRELVHSIASPEGYLFVTFANHHYTRFALTWVAHLRALNLTNFIIGALDEGILTELAQRRINTFDMAGGLTKDDFGWGTKVFAAAQRRKIALFATVLTFGVHVIVSDIDAMWVRDPIPFFQTFLDADILSSSDAVATTVGANETLENYPHVHGGVNIGVVLFRASSLPLVAELLAVIETNITLWEQNVFSELVHTGEEVPPPETNPHHYWRGYNQSLAIGVLPVTYFCGGFTFFVNDLPAAFGVQPYAVHATFQFSGTSGKRHRFRERLLWADPGEYFGTPGGFLVYEPDVPQALLNASGPRTGKPDLANVIGHFDLVNHQLTQLRTAFALATVLNRTLILPKLWCGLDRWWSPHSGVTPGANLTLPFECPADHVLDLEFGLTKEFNEQEFGPGIPFREYSFLDNPRLPSSVIASAVTVTLCKADTPGCNNGSGPATLERNKVAIAADMDSERIKIALSGAQGVPLLRFESMHGAFGNFTAPADWSRFALRMGTYGSVWCCIDAHPGHIAYDMLWDVPGHTDRHGRVWDKWNATAGP